MKLYVTLSVIALICLMPCHDAHGAQPTQPKSKSLDNNHKIKGSQAPSSPLDSSDERSSTLKRKLTNLSIPSLRGKSSLSDSEGSSPSPKAEQPHHVIWFFGQDNIPLECLSIGEVGTPCHEKLINILNANFIRLLFPITSDDTKQLNQDCEDQLVHLLKYSNIGYVYPTQFPKIRNVCESFSGYIEEGQHFAVYGISISHKALFVLACWSLCNVIENAIKKNHHVKIYNEEYALKDILLSPKLHDFAIKDLLKIAINRVTSDEMKRKQFIENEPKLSKFCIDYLHAVINKKNLDFPDLEEK